MSVIFSETWTGSDGASWPAAWTIYEQDATGVEDIQSNKGRLVTPTGATYSKIKVLHSGNSKADLEVYVEFDLESPSAEQYLHFGVRNAGDTGYGDQDYCYLAEVDKHYSDAIIMVKWSGYSRTVLGNLSMTGLSVGTTYKFRFRVQGSLIQSKVWQGSSEPATWGYETVDTTVTSAGIQHLRAEGGNATTARTVTLDNYSIDDLSPSDHVLVPVGDMAINSWTTDTGATTGLHYAIDELSYSDTDYIQSAIGATSASYYETLLEPHYDPASSSGHKMHYRYRRNVTAEATDLVVKLMEGATTRVTRTHTGISNSWTAEDYTLSSGEADSITDYTNLRLRFEPTVAAASPLTPTVTDTGVTANSNSQVTTVDLALSGLTVGQKLLIATSAENSGGGGARRSITATNQSGTAIDTGTLEYHYRNYDPGAAGAGSTANAIIATISGTSGTVRLTYSGAVYQACKVFTLANVGAVVGTPVGADGANSTNVAAPQEASVASGNLVFAIGAIEGPSSDTYTADSDTTGGAWTAFTKLGTSNATATDNQTVYGGYKVPNSTGAQTWDATINNARDSAGLIIEFAAATATQTTRAQVSYANVELPTPSNVGVTLTVASITLTAVAITPSTSGPAGVNVDLTPATITVSAIALGITTGAVSITLTPATITTTAVPLAVQRYVDLSPATINVSAIPLTVTPGAISVTLTTATITATAIPLTVSVGPSNITLTPATIALTAVPLGISAGAVSITLTPATITVSAIEITPAAVPPARNVDLTPATISVTAIALGITAGAVSVTLTPATATLAAVALAPSGGAVSIALQPATVALTAVPLAITTGAVSVALTPAVLTITAVNITPLTGTTVVLVPASITLTAIPLQVSTPVSVELVPATIAVSAVPLIVQQYVALTPATITATAIPLGITTGAVTLQLTPVTVTVTAVPLGITTGGVSLTLVAATITITAVELVPVLGNAPQEVALVPAVITITAMRLRVGGYTIRSQFASGELRRRYGNDILYRRYIAGALSRREESAELTR